MRAAIFANVLALVRQYRRFFLIVALAALVLRALFVILSPRVTPDSLFYADIAKNWLSLHIYALTDNGRIIPTYVRLPGYPAFLVVVFALLGKDSFRAVMWIQVLVDLGTCFVVADLARRMIGSERAAKIAFLLTALCPFFANYTAAPLTETLAIFSAALAFDFAVAGLDSGSSKHWIACGGALAGGILLRPDGGLLLIAIGIYLSWRWLRTRTLADFRPLVLVGVTALLPLVPWTLRNLRTFHVFQPLTPFHSNGPDEYLAEGFNRWVRTWMADYVSVQEIYWKVSGEDLDFADLPERAFDNHEQWKRTSELFDAYNQDNTITRDLDAQFAALADERIRASRFRYYVRLPLLRAADLWLRPRNELVPSDPRWWEFDDSYLGSALAVGFGLINLFYVGAALGGCWEGSVRYLALFILFTALRTLFMCRLENPEPRYVLECYPGVLVAAAAWLSTWSRSQPSL